MEAAPEELTAEQLDGQGVDEVKAASIALDSNEQHADNDSSMQQADHADAGADQAADIAVEHAPAGLSLDGLAVPEQDADEVGPTAAETVGEPSTKAAEEHAEEHGAVASESTADSPELTEQHVVDAALSAGDALSQAFSEPVTTTALPDVGPSDAQPEPAENVAEAPGPEPAENIAEAPGPELSAAAEVAQTSAESAAEVAKESSAGAEAAEPSSAAEAEPALGLAKQPAADVPALALEAAPGVAAEATAEPADAAKPQPQAAAGDAPSATEAAEAAPDTVAAPDTASAAAAESIVGTPAALAMEPEGQAEQQGEPNEAALAPQPSQVHADGSVPTDRPPTAESRPTSAAVSLPQSGSAQALAVAGSDAHGGQTERSASFMSAVSQTVQHVELPDAYDKGAFMEPIDPETQMPLEAVRTNHILSLDAYKRNNLAYIEDHVLVTSAGNKVIFIDLNDMSHKYMSGLDGGGIGALAVHPSRKYLAVAEKCRQRSPNVYIFTYPDLVLHRVLRAGTERAYSSLTFNDRGNILASVGGYPDYLLTLWNWQEESITLRSKAFSQDVYTVRFSPYFEGLLNTSGTGHIRFWKVASTFTGLKLQGQLGKFGAVELTDVVAFVEMPDGKVLSSTETGELLMWDGGLIKVVLTRSDKRPCHDGAIHVLLHDRPSNCIVTGGADGYVRLWNFAKINEAEAEEDSNHMVITPVDEMLIAPGARIKHLLWERQHWLIQDEAGAIYKVTLPTSGVLSKGAAVARLLDFHSGGIVGMHLSPVSHTAVTAGSDGSLRVFDYVGRKTVAVSRFSQAATAMTPLGASGLILAAGFQDGVVRIVRRCSDGLGLLSAWKPHKGRVTALLLSPDGQMLATAGADSTVFFFAFDTARGGMAAGALKPVGYSQVPAVASCCMWTEDSKTLLCGTVAGTVFELLAPNSDTVDVTKTYETAGLLQRQFTFKCPKPPRKKKVIKAEASDTEGQGAEGAVPAAEGADAAKPAEAAEGEAQVEGEVKEEDEEEEEVQDEDAEAPKVLTIRQAPSGIPGAFLLTLDGKAAGTVWLCSLDMQPDEPAAPFAPACGATSATPSLVIPAPAPTTYFKYGGLRSELLLMGSADGMVRVQGAAANGAAEGLYWQAPLHDMVDGAITAVRVSFDGAYLLSAAADGTLYVQEMRLPGTPQPALSGLEELPQLSQCVAVTPDIITPTEYTIEEAKQKAEQDALMAAAEQKKMGVREYLLQIRKEFEAMLAENQARPESERLPRAEFEIDPGLRDMMEEEAKAKEHAARMELAWDTEKRRLALAKLKAFFLDKVEVERIVLYALQSKMFVTTFRTAKLPDNILEELREAQQQQQEEQQAATKEAEAALRSAAGARGDGADGGMLGGASSMAGRKSGITDAAATAAADSDTGRMTKADLRRLARKKREAEWAAFTATKPDDKYENPADVAAIEQAERNMGDFKLKSDSNYVIPEEQRMTPQRKRLQMLLLEEAIYKVKMEFNAKFLALRDVKKKVISEINSRLAKLKDINAQLAARETAAAQPPAAATQGIVAGFTTDLSLKPEEQPEIREVVTEEDLEEFARKKEQESRAAQGSGLGGFAGGGGGGAAAAAKGRNGSVTAGAKAGAATGKATTGADQPGAASAAQTADEALAKMMAAVPLSDFEKSLQAFQKKRLDHAKAKLQEEVVEMVEAFDEALGSLRREKFKLEADVKMAEMKQLVHYQELVLLRDFDKREVVLIQKRQAKLDDRKDIMDKIGECNNKLEQKRVELEGLMARRASVLADFDGLVPESDPFREPLSKIFYRRIKRSKKKATADDEEDGEEEEEEEDGEEGDEDDDDDDEEVCPPGCDHGLYERVCEQREKRLDEDDLIAEFQKTIEVVKKEKETAAKKQKLVEQSLAAIQQDITEFQREKQGRLNQIDVVVNLKMHQIEYLVDGRMPVDLSQGLVFSDKELEKLKRRIEELDQEKADLRARQKTLKKEHVQLLKDKRAKEDRVSELEAKAYDVQMLKFGQVIDLDLLDRMGASKGTEELKDQLKAQEAQYAKELAEWDKKIAARTDELMALTRENTNCLNVVSELTQAQRKLESSLATARTTMFSDPVVKRKQEVQERDQLVQLVNAQASEIQKLKAQINALHRKDTSVYQ